MKPHQQHHPHSQQQSPRAQPPHQQQRKWIHAIQNASFRPKPAAFSPLGSREENPLLEQQRQCRDKLDALAHVRRRVGFVGGAGVQIHTRMVLAQLESDSLDHRRHQHQLLQPAAGGIDALAGLEALLFAFLTHEELVRVSAVCRSWKDTARHNVIWEPLLVTSVERYPLRALLGASRDLPAIQVYMIFRRLRLSELPKELEKRSAMLDPRRHQQVLPQPPQLLPHRIRFAEERNRLLALLRGAQDGRAAEVANVLPGLTRHRLRRGVVLPPTPSSPPVNSIHIVGFRESSGVSSTTAGMAPDVQDLLTEEANTPEQLVELLAAARARPDREEELQFVKDGYRRTTLRTWLLQQQQRRTKLSEHTLRSFLRQMLLAIHALESANTAHSEISTTSIVVLEPESTGTDDATTDNHHATPEQLYCDTTPLFQLDCSRNIVHVGLAAARTPAAVVPRQNLQQQHQRAEEAVFEDMRGQQPQQQEAHPAARIAAALNEDMEGEDDILELAEDALNRPLHMPCMFNSLFRCALSMWARGRYPDSSAITTTPLLSLLVLLHGHIPAGFQSFLEYGKFLTDSGMVSAAHLLNHVFVSADPHSLSSIPIRMIQSQDVLDYQASVRAWYGNAHALAGARTATQQGQRNVEAPPGDANERDHLQTTVPSLELMPRTRMATAYLLHALKEPNLARERFVSIQAPEIRSSSWIRKVAETQRHTLQRLDLSRVMLPTSVLLKELENLPRITHLRLPSKIERPDDLEHFLAALSCTDVLPNLYAMDENVKLAMDRMEQAYQEQLDMIEFLLAR